MYGLITGYTVDYIHPGVIELTIIIKILIYITAVQYTVALKILYCRRMVFYTSLVHKIRLHGRRGKGMAESFSREKLRHAPQKEGG